MTVVQKRFVEMVRLKTKILKETKNEGNKRYN